MTKEVLDRMPEAVKRQVSLYKQAYNRNKGRASLKGEVSLKAVGYVNGLKDAGLVTEYEARALFIYITV